DRSHLGEGADWFGQASPNGENAGDRGGADRTEANEQHTKLAARRIDFKRCRHGEKLYHFGMLRFGRRDNPHMLAVGMTGVNMGDRLLEIGCADGGRLAAIAAKVGLSGRAVAVVPDEAAATRARKGAARAGVLVE